MHPFLIAAGTAAAAVLTAGLAAPRAALPVPTAPDTIPSSSRWLNLLPDGVTKRRFILDCTGCHQFDEKIARPQGSPRTETQWAEAITACQCSRGLRTPVSTQRVSCGSP